MSKYITIRVKRPEGYEDVCDELVFEDFLDTPKDPEWEPELVRERK